MVVTSDIQFENNPNAIFYAGQVINGKVTLTADKVKQVKAVVLKITGSAESRWSETTGTGDKRKSVTYWGQENYINTVTYLMSPPTSDQSVVIEPGIHTFSFACHLPANCPSSFEGYNGNIRYIVQVILDRPWKFDQKFTKAFTVLNVMNLNYYDPMLAGVYMAGQIVNGKVTITCDKRKTVKAVSLKINGNAHTKWTEEDSFSTPENKTETTYYAHIDYIKSKRYLFLSPEQKANNSEGVVIEPGVHSFSFNCQIPDDSPTSVEAIKGRIRYWIQITLKRPWKFAQIYTRGFSVINARNFNLEEDRTWQLPVSTDVSKVFCCGPCKSDPLQMLVQLPQTGYVPGQLIPISILVTNETRADINEMCARLVMVIDFFSDHPSRRSKQETKVVSKLIGDPVLRYTKKQFNYLLPIPATPASCNTLCRIIHIGYRVEVEAKINGFMYANQCTHTPITIGNVPLETGGLVVQQQPMPSNFSTEENGKGVETNITVNSCLENNNDPCTSNRNGEPWWATSNIPPPVYVEADHIIKAQLSQDSEHDYGEKTFTPKYPVFNIPTPTSPQAPNKIFPNGDEVDGHAMASAVTDPDKTTWL